MRTAYHRRRDAAVTRLREMPGVELHAPQGAFYAFPRVARASRCAGGSIALAGKLVEAGVAVVPGAAFGAEDHVRISFALGDDRLEEGLRRLGDGLEAVAAGRPALTREA
jgi:aspartate/methionine/tyrosine aminotransferase